MPLPSLYVSGDKARAWSIVHAAAYGAVLGTLAGLLKSLGVLPRVLGGPAGTSLLTNIPETLGAAAGFALLCAAAAALRNFIARRLIWPEVR